MERNQKDIETGAAEIRIILKNGDIEIRHGDSGELLAMLWDAPKGTWRRLWIALDNLGFKRKESAA